MATILQYSGDIIDGTINGEGRAIYRDNEVYDGEWKSGKRHGKGTYTFSNGSVYRLIRFSDYPPLIASNCHS